MLASLALARSADASPSTAPKTLWVQVYADDALSEPQRRALERAVAAGITESGTDSKVRIGHPELAPLIDAVAIGKALARSDKALREARKRVQNLEEGALDLLDWAADEYARYLPELIARDGGPAKLVAVYAQTAIAGYLNGDNSAAQSAIRRALVLEPGLEYDPAVFPPQLEELVLQEGLMFEELGRGTVEVAAEGGSEVMVFVNGVERGKAPLTVADLPAGPNIVSLVVAGVEPVVLEAKVEGDKTLHLQGAVQVPASRVTGPLAGSRGQVGGPKAGAKLRRAGKTRGVRGLVLVLPQSSAEGLVLVAYVYDLRGQVLVGRTETTLATGASLAEAETFGRELMATAAWKVAVELSPTRAPLWERAYRHKYFWPAVGATAGAVLFTVAISAATGGLSPGKTVSVLPLVRF